MLKWHPVSSEEVRLMEAISILLSEHEGLLDFLFEEEVPYLRADPKDLLQRSRHFPREERILIQLALDIWSVCEFTRVRELLDGLKQSQFESVLLSLQFLGSNLSYKEYIKNHSEDQWSSRRKRTSRLNPCSN
jgi:hypothetical protein